MSNFHFKTPTSLTPERIKEFQRLYKKNFGEDISYENARERGLSLIRLVTKIYEIEARHARDSKKEDLDSVSLPSV